MNFEHLNIIVNHIRQQVNCPKCKKKYRSDNVYIIGGSPYEEFLHFHCPKCSNDMLFSIGIIGPTATITRIHRSIRTQSASNPISSNDILDMTNFLKTLNGDITSYIKKSST